MALKAAMNEILFEELLAKIIQETDSNERKLEILYSSKGFFNAEQAQRILYALGSPSDKLRAASIMESRLCSMSCVEANQILEAVSIHNDKVVVQATLSRALVDSQQPPAQAALLDAHPYEYDKMRSMHLLHKMDNLAKEQISAGGHQHYSALGGLYGQNFPLDTHLYGDVKSQMEKVKNMGYPTSEVFSGYNSNHPSYAYRPDPRGTYAQDRHLPATRNIGDESMPYVNHACGMGGGINTC